MAEYTAKEIVDIVFQKEDRITANMAQSSKEKLDGTNMAQKFVSKLFSVFGKKDDREPGCPLYAKDELLALGMDEDVLCVHLGNFMKVIQEEHTNAMGIIAIETDDVLFVNHIEWGLEHKLGFKHVNHHNPEQSERIREIVEKRAYIDLLSRLEGAVEEHPYLLQTSKPKGSGLAHNL